MSRKLLTLGVCALLVFGQFGCGDDKEESSKDKPKGESPPSTRPAPPADPGGRAQQGQNEYEEALDGVLKAQVRIAALLKTVKDADSAKAIVPLLKKAVAERDKHMAAIQKLPEPSAELDKQLEKKFKTRKDAADAAMAREQTRLQGMPEAAKILGPVLGG